MISFRYYRMGARDWNRRFVLAAQESEQQPGPGHLLLMLT